MIRPTFAQLEAANRLHRLELKKLRHMNEAQFQVFKRNFSFGHLENITKLEAEALLTSMLALNLKIKSEIAEPVEP